MLRRMGAALASPPLARRTGSNGLIVGDKSARCTCFRCGDRVCSKCSAICVVKPKVRARLCFICQPPKEHP